MRLFAVRDALPFYKQAQHLLSAREQAHQTFARAMAIVQKLAAKMEDEAKRSNFHSKPSLMASHA